MSGLLVLGITGAYLALLFTVAFYVDSHARASGSSSPFNAWIYALSLAVYCTSWTFYGSVGRASVDGLGFLPIYIGPILVFVLGQQFLRKMQHVCATQHITSIADFISARYGKSQHVAGFVSVIALIGIVPYISLQLKAVSTSIDLLSHYPTVTAQLSAPATIWGDTAFYLALLMALFVIVFGTRHVDATEQHRGMVCAIALESLVKLAAFLAVGVFVTYGMFDGAADLLARAAERTEMAPLLQFSGRTQSSSFWLLTALAAVAIVCLPRQFQVTMVESGNPDHLKLARWVFPLYLVAINLFVLPIALAGLLTFGGQGIAPDTFVLTLPMSTASPMLSLLAYIGGFSAATGMIIVETIALSTMICNDLVLPILIHRGLIAVDAQGSIGKLVKGIRRASIVFILMLGYAYVRLVGDSYALVSIGLVSFCAVAQFAPAMVGGLFWRRGNRAGALAGLGLGFAVWLYTLLLPSFARSGWLPAEFSTEGIFSIDALRPYALFGLSGLDPVSHSLVWSMVFNTLAYVVVSLRSRQSTLEEGQAEVFVDAFAKRVAAQKRSWSGEVTKGQLMALLARFIDPERVQRACAEYALARQGVIDPAESADSDFVGFAERLLSGAIGAAMARVVIAASIRENDMNTAGAMDLISGASREMQTQWEQTREAIENISQGISMADSEHRLVIWNRRFFDLLGLPERFAVRGTPLESILRYNAERGEYGPGDVEALVAQRMMLAAKREPHLFERVRPDGTVIEVRGKPLQDGGFVTTYTDITERKQAERALHQAHHELELRVAERTEKLSQALEHLKQIQGDLIQAEKLASLGSMVAGVSHELNTPIGVAVTTSSALREQVMAMDNAYRAGTLKRSEMNEGLHAVLEMSALIESSVTRAARLITSFKQVAVDQTSERRREFELHEVVGDVVSAVFAGNTHPHLRIETAVPPGMRCDSFPGVLELIVTNLIQNAVIHAFVGRDSGSIRIAASTEGMHFDLSISDDGIGMDGLTLAHVFDPFFTTQLGKGGSGLGLAICYRLAKNVLAGELRASSELGKGSRFVLSIPACAPWKI